MTHPALADETALDTFDAGPCVCPGTPHERDTITHLADLGYDDVVAISAGATRTQVRMVDQGKGQPQKPEVVFITDPFGIQVALLERMVTGWSYVDADGNPLPLNPRRLRESIANPLAEKLDAIYEHSRRPLPNGSGGPSPAPSLELVRPNRATRRSRTKAGARHSN